MESKSIIELINNMPYFDNHITDEKALEWIGSFKQIKSADSNLASIYDPCYPDKVLVQVPTIDKLPEISKNLTGELNISNFFIKLLEEAKQNQSTLEYLETIQTGKPIRNVSTIEIPSLLQEIEEFCKTADEGLRENNPDEVILFLDEGFSRYLVQILPLVHQRKRVTVLCHPQCFLSVSYFTQLCHNAGLDQSHLATYCTSSKIIEQLPNRKTIICSKSFNKKSIIQSTTTPTIIVFDSADIPSAIDSALEVYIQSASNNKTYQGIRLLLSENIEAQFQHHLKQKLSTLERSGSLNYNTDLAQIPVANKEKQTNKDVIEIDTLDVKKIYGIEVISFRNVKEGLSLLNSFLDQLVVGPVSVWTEKLTLALEASKLIRSSTIWINTQNISDSSLPSQLRSNNLNCLRVGGKIYDEEFQQQTNIDLILSKDASISKKDVLAILEKSGKAQKSWAVKKYKERARSLRLLTNSIPFKDIEKEHITSFIKYWTEDLDHLFTGRIVETASCKTVLVYNEPKGVVQIIANENLKEAFKDVFSNLIMGNTVIAYTSTYEKELKEIFSQLPEGIFQLINANFSSENKTKSIGDSQFKNSFKEEMEKYISLRTHCKHIWIPYGEIV